MNCKPGDLAIFVRSDAGNEGLIVRVIELLNSYERAQQDFRYDAVWRTDTKAKQTSGGRTPHAPDEYLRPIGDHGDDAQCESAAWLPPVPTHQTEAA